MPSNHSLPTYVTPCTRKGSDSIGSVWLQASDFGECHVRPSDTEFYPCLVPVYNGQALNINTELVHASLSGISVKHYYGKCYKEPSDEYLKEEDEEEGEHADYGVGGEELYEGMLFGSEGQLRTASSRTSCRDMGTEPKEDSMEDFEDPNAHLPICMRQRINYRNSFWNLHKPELCKLTWSQKYVSTVTVTEHLHNHLVSHGTVCGDYHHEATRAQMLLNELNEYGKLKVIAHPRELPPDEKPYGVKPTENTSKFCSDSGARCQGFPRRKPMEMESKFLSLSDDEDEISAQGRSLHLSKEEFCMTIGKHIRKASIKKSISEIEESYTEEEGMYIPEEEECGFFFFNWQELQAEDDYEEATDSDSTTIDLEPVPMVEPCPPLGMSDFCRAVAKADFSDLRCHPDDF